MQELFEKYKTDQQYRAKIKLCIYVMFVILVTIYAISLSKRVPTNNSNLNMTDSDVEKETKESIDNESLIEIATEMKYKVLVSTDKVKYEYVIEKKDRKEYITKIINNEQEEYLYEENKYYKKENNNYTEIKKHEIDENIDYDYLRLETINLYINKGTKNNNDYLIYIKDIIIGNHSDDYFVINLNANKIFIDYTPLIKNFNKDLKNIQIEIILEK